MATNEETRGQIREITEMFGGEAGPVEVNVDEIEVSLALQALRAQLLEAAEKTHVGVNQLSRRLRISPSAVSRRCRRGSSAPRR